MANITGGGFLNLHRLGKFGYTLDNLPKPPMVFKKIQELGKISDQEMHKTFNMGVGFCIVVSQEDARDIVEKYGKEYQLQKIGDVIGEDKIVIVKDGNEMTLERSLY